MYKGTDRAELQYSIEDANDVMKQLHEIAETIGKTVLENKKSIMDELADIINDIADQLPEMQDAYTDACRVEEDEERRGYENDLMDVFFGETRKTEFWQKYIQI